jgi:serine/threonine protein phosphatase 1
MILDKIKFYGDGRCFFVGDLHGCFLKFKKALLAVNFDYDLDIVVCTGDLIDRGTQNIDCLMLLNEHWFYSVMGNHEEMAYKALILQDDYMNRVWLSNGGMWIKNLNIEERKQVYLLFKDKVAQLPYLIEVELSSGDTIGVAHADLVSNNWLEMPSCIDKDKKAIKDVTWGRKRIGSIEKCYAEGNYSNLPLSILNITAVVFGHTVVEKPVNHENCLWIDTGACFDGEITLIESKDVILKCTSNLFQF